MSSHDQHKPSRSARNRAIGSPLPGASAAPQPQREHPAQPVPPVSASNLLPHNRQPAPPATRLVFEVEAVPRVISRRVSECPCFGRSSRRD